MNLEDWQAHLAKHFADLRTNRSSKMPERPIFGLEHNLDESAVNDLACSIRSDIKERSPLWDHRLAWVVYASELGYVYAGDEYWQTFEADTPGWECHGDRHRIRRCFLDFQENYNGAQPTGAWARHFSIICWPITHAILPRDLQRQLAQLLYELRFSFSQQVLESPRQLGELIAARSWKASRRFQQLAEEPLFLGQIATALLLPDSDSTSALINTSTLRRISADVDRERGARAWLRGARQKAQHRIQFRHIRGQSTGERDSENGRDLEPGQTARSWLEPELLLRPCSSGTWELLLELPNFSQLYARSRSLTETLKNTRCFVSGSTGRPLARGRLLHGNQQVALKSWPVSNEPLLRLENSTPELDSLLHAECSLRPVTIRLFKVAHDGLGYELRTLNVRPKHKYVILAEMCTQLDACPEFTPVMIECEGINSIELNIGDTIPQDLVATLTNLGIGQTTTISIWPAGLTSNKWDGEGNAEWLSTERPRLGICAEHQVASFEVDLGFDKISLPCSTLGAPVFVELPELDPGYYTIVIKGIHDDGTTTECATLNIRVRDPRTPSLGYGNDSPILVVLVPANPTLEQLWEGKFECRVYGPPSRKVGVQLEFFGKGSSQPICSSTGPPMPLPVDSRMWRDYCNKYFRTQRNIQNAYDDAQSCHVSVVARELGTFAFTVEREFTPVRWVVRRTRDEFYLRVLDDSGSEQESRITRYEFDSPDIGTLLDLREYSKTDGNKASAGLYVARTGDYWSGVVIPPKVHTLQDLAVEPKISERSRSVGDVSMLIRTADLWGSARSTGNIFSLHKRRHVLKTLFEGMFSLVAGPKWSEGERSLGISQGISPLAGMEPFIKKKNEIQLAEYIHQQEQWLYQQTPKERVQFLANMAKEFLHLSIPHAESSDEGVDPDDELVWLCEISLRLASASSDVSVWAGDRLSYGINYLLETPSLARSARFMVLSLDYIMDPEEIKSLVYMGWTWE